MSIQSFFCSKPKTIHRFLTKNMLILENSQHFFYSLLLNPSSNRIVYVTNVVRFFFLMSYYGWPRIEIKIQTWCSSIQQMNK